VVSPIITNSAPDPAASGMALRHAIEGITGASPTNPYLVKLEPGIYDLGATDLLRFKDNVDVEGSGEDASVIVSQNGVYLANAQVRSLRVRQVARQQFAVGCATKQASLLNVTIELSDSDAAQTGLRAGDCMLTLENVKVIALAGQHAGLGLGATGLDLSNSGAWNSNGGVADIHNLQLQMVCGTGVCTGLMASNGTYVNVRDSSVNVQGATVYAFRTEGSALFLDGVQARASGIFSASGRSAILSGYIGRGEVCSIERSSLIADPLGPAVSSEGGSIVDMETLGDGVGLGIITIMDSQLSGSLTLDPKALPPNLRCSGDYDQAARAVSTSCLKVLANQATTGPLPAHSYDKASQRLTAAGPGELTIASLGIYEGERVLVKDEPDATQNGVYEIVSAGAADSNWKLQRVFEMQASQQLKSGMMVECDPRWLLQPSVFRLTTNDPIALDTMPLTFEAVP
jgi:hypothetical protein